MTKKPTTGKTKLVLDALGAGVNTIPAITSWTKLALKDVHAIVYRLEEQRRVVADNYKKARSLQVLSIIRLEPDLSRNFKRIHPTKEADEALKTALAVSARSLAEQLKEMRCDHPLNAMCVQLLAGTRTAFSRSL